MFAWVPAALAFIWSALGKSIVTRTLVAKLLLTAVLVPLLWNLAWEGIDLVGNWIVDRMSDASSGITPGTLTFQFVGLGAWIADKLNLAACVAVTASCVAARFAIGVIRAVIPGL